MIFALIMLGLLFLVGCSAPVASVAQEAPGVTTIAPSATAAPTVGQPSPLTPGPTIAAPTPVVGNLQVQMESYGFIPEPAVIRVGGTITWINGDTWLHSATSFDGVFNTGLLRQNETYSVTFTQPGEFPYYCMRHPSVLGRVVVTP
ncbi:MAG: hypothetical protein HC822_21320 [Oscillochloris sp.]|nr:hypothetical protein [Oscillochloris sp.]